MASLKRIAAVLTLLIVVTVPGGAVADPAGVVTRLKGVALAVTGDRARALQVDSTLAVGDRVTTFASTRIEMRMADGAVITLGDDSELIIDDDRPAERGLAASVTRGVFLAVSGALADGRSEPLTITTAIAVLGVRGTSLWGRQQPDQLEVALLDGRGIFVEAGGRRVDITIPLDGLTVRPGQPPGEPKPWSAERLAAARRSVAFD
jgi:hypothetical protein